MIFHNVEQGETIQSIANNYGVDVELLKRENNIDNQETLAIGQILVIEYPKETYTVKEGDNLGDIAKEFQVDLKQLYRNNPYLQDRRYIYPGDLLIVSYEGEPVMDITTMGYVYSFVDLNVLRKNLLYLTYLSVFRYMVVAGGSLVDINDEEIIDLAKAYNVAPIMVVSNVSITGEVDRDITHDIMSSKKAKENLTKDIIGKLKEKGYYGVNIDFTYVQIQDRSLTYEYISSLSQHLKEEGYKLFITLTPQTFELKNSYREIDYSLIGEISDGVILLSYAWGRTTEISFSMNPFFVLEEYIEYISSRISPNIIIIGITSIGYMWKLPFVQGLSTANSISYENAIKLASEKEVTIYDDPVTLFSYYYFLEEDYYYVTFHDAREVYSILYLVYKYQLQGVSLWNVMSFLGQNFFMINTLFRIEEVEV